MIGIKVCRGSSFSGQCKESDPALNWGPDISDSLLSTEDAAFERGAAEINETSTNRTDISFKSNRLDFIQPGSFIGLAEENNQKNGIVQSTSITIKRSGNKITANSSFQLEGGA